MPYLNKCDFDMTFSDHTGNTEAYLGKMAVTKSINFDHTRNKHYIR